MSFTFTLTGRKSELSVDLNPPIYLDENKEYFLGLADFETFMTIPNIEEGKNKLYLGDSVITIPEGTYDISDIDSFVREEINKKFKDERLYLEIKPNLNTLKCYVKCTKAVDFTKEDSIGDILGFERKVLSENIVHESDNVTNISKVNTIMIDCNICVGSYNNDKPVHVIHQFYPLVPAGYKIVESPLPILYFPVSVKTISNITIKIIDQNSELINFRNETITIRLHLKVHDGNSL